MSQKPPKPAKPKDIARLFMHGRSQAVRLPKQFRMPGDRVRVRRQGRGIVLEPVEFDVRQWLKDLNAAAGGQFLPEGRPEQPPMPDDGALDNLD